MTSKKSGLGKGLDALFGSNEVYKDILKEQKQQEEVIENEVKEHEDTVVDNVVTNLKLVDIEPNKDQARKKFDDEALDDLANSIKEYGVIQPIIVTKKGGYYQIIAGERRWRASKKAGLTEIPAIIKDDDEKRNKEISLIENIQREDLNPIEKARGIKELMDEYNLTQAKVAEILGKSRSSIANTVRVLNLDERVIDLALAGKLTEGHCKALLAIDDLDKQYEMAVYMVEHGDSVRDAEAKVKNNKKKGSSKKKDARYDAIYRDIENSFQNFFGTKVKLNAGPKKGKIVIQYNSNDELERIMELIKK